MKLNREIRYRLYLPPRFLDKEVNEEIVFHMMNAVKHYDDVRRGDPNWKEPDFIVDNEGLEVTLASDNHSNPSFINEFCDGVFSPADLKNDSFQYIRNALERKSKKEYSTQRTSLAILCMLELFPWVSSDYDAYTAPSFYDRCSAFVEEIARQYVDSSLFENVYLLLPDLQRHWYVQDIGERRLYPLTILKDAPVPYYERLY